MIIKDKYKIIKEIGSGSFGKVYEVEDISDKNKPHYAIKRLNREDIIKNEYLYAAYWKELEIMKDCDCNNSVKLIEHFVTTSNLNIVMEICDEDLDRWVNKYKGNITEDVLKEILIQLNVAFKIMNEKNIVHRDLKLKNIMLKYSKENNGSVLNFTPKLIDFGFSRVVDEDIMKTKLGTPATMAPEILRGSPYSKTCDLWSLGIIIYQILFKQHPFRARNEQEILKLITTTNGNFKIPDGMTISKPLNDLLRKMLTVDPNKRISWEDYFNHSFFASGDSELERFDKTYFSARKLSDDNQGLYVLTKAKNRFTGEYVYIKEFDRSFIDSDYTRKDLFKKELNLTKLLSNKSNAFVKYIDYFETKSTYYIIIEYFEGKLLENFINGRGSLGDTLINEILRQIIEGLEVFHKEKIFLESLTTKSLWFKFFKDEKNFELKFFDYGIAKIYNDEVFEASYDLNSKCSLEKKNVLSFGLILYKLCFGCSLFKLQKNDDINKLAKKNNGMKIKISKAIPKLVKALLERTIHFNIDKRYSLKELLEDTYISKIRNNLNLNFKNLSLSNNNNINDNTLYFSDFKVENLVESIITKAENTLKYFSRLQGLKFVGNSVKKFQIDSEIEAENSYYSPFIKQICIFNTLLHMEIQLCLEFINKNFEDDSEIHLIKINQSSFDYSFCDLIDDKVMINSENPKLEEYNTTLLLLKEQIYCLLKVYLEKINISIDDINTYDYLQESMKNFYMTSTEKYFFALFDKGVKYFTEGNKKKALEEVMMSKYYYENLLFIRMISHCKQNTIEFKDLYECIEQEDYLNITSEIKQDKLCDLTSVVLVTFLGGVYKTFKNKKIIEEDLTSQSTIGISKDAVDSLMSFYPDIIKLAAEC